jgi:aldehyde:ferredoxin oxidoreductase
MEYENTFALGPLCGVGDPDIVIAASGRCDELGLDTISTGGTIAWAMECAERGLIEAPWLRFGDGEVLLRTIDEVGNRQGIGDLLAEGSRRAAQIVGRGSDAFAAHVKGLELPGYDPRTLQAMGLGLAVNARGADHNRSGAYEVDLSGEHDRVQGGEAHVKGAIETEDRAAIMDSLILCKFLRGVFTEGGRGGSAVRGRDPFSEWARLLSTVTGWDIDAAELRRTARRIVMTKRLFNLREGWTRDEDWLPERFLSEPVVLSSGRTATLSAERLESMIRAYYGARGLEPTGVPRLEALDELGLAGWQPGSGQSRLGEQD